MTICWAIAGHVRARPRHGLRFSDLPASACTSTTSSIGAKTANLRRWPQLCRRLASIWPDTSSRWTSRRIRQIAQYLHEFARIFRYLVGLRARTWRVSSVCCGNRKYTISQFGSRSLSSNEKSWFTSRVLCETASKPGHFLQGLEEGLSYTKTDVGTVRARNL